jgi:phosphatidylglycerol:prolipoprotein diacylglycerol transferase
MCPRLLEIGPFTIYSYGLMLAIGFITGSYLLTMELKRKRIDAAHASTITLVALVGGIVGSKLLYLIEHWSAFLADPSGMAFSPGGLTFYGGFLLAAFLVYVYAKKKRIAFLTIADSVAPGLIIAYGIGRLGCHFAGDGDYGFPTDLPWGTDYSKGTYPPSLAFKNFPEIAGKYQDGIPDTILCHPTPVYEFLICLAGFSILWRLRTRITQSGKLFMLYLMLATVERFSIEFMRLNPRIAFGLSEAQLISLVLFIVGLIGWGSLSRRPQTS